MANIRIPVYSALTPKQRQRVHLMLGGLAFVCLFLIVSALIGGGNPTAPAATTAPAPTTKSLSSVAGEHVDPQTAWVGGAGKTLANMDATLRDQQQKQERLNDEMQRQIDEMRKSRGTGVGYAQEAAPAGTAPASSPTSSTRVAEGATVGGEQFHGGASSQRPPPQVQPGTYPPGQPIGADGQQAPAAEPSIGVFKVSLVQKTAGDDDGKGKDAARAGAAAASKSHQVDTFLPISFVRAVLLGGMDAPTGGQAQRDPIPIILKLVDNAFLPNEYRSAVKDCFVIADGYGDVSSERAYGRTQTLSCVLKNGQSLEVPIKGSIFGEDGKNGMRGRLVTKQGSILANALLSGIASGIGQGLVASTQTTSISALGATTTGSSGASEILKSGLGSGVGHAMDRLAQYYINLAERTFPVIEIDAGRMVDIVITQGVTLDGKLGVSSDGSAPVNTRTINRSEMLNAVNEGTE